MVFLKLSAPGKGMGHHGEPCCKTGTRCRSLGVHALVISLLIWALVIPGRVSSAETGQYDFKSASQLLKQGLYLEALEAYHNISTSNPRPDERARALLFSSSVYNNYLNLPETALKYLQMISDLYPETSADPDALFNRGIILYTQSRFREAHNCFNLFIKTYPEMMRTRSARMWSESSRTKIAETPSRSKIRNGILKRDTILRVLTHKDIRTVTFSSASPLTVSDPSNEKPFYHGAGPVHFLFSEKGVLINNILTGSTSFKIESDGRILSVDDRAYRGFFEVHQTGHRFFSMVNHLPVEEYLLGVVPQEMNESWSREALKAQAVASRTYALYIKEKQPPQALYDIEATTSAQVYGGFDAERKRASTAVADTRGKVLTYNGKLAIAYFHADSGGHTENPVHVWGVEIPYLKALSDKFSRESRKAWHYHLSFNEIEKKFKRAGIKTGKVIAVRPEGKTPSGRIPRFAVVGLRKTTRVTGNNFRTIMGTSNLKSTLFSLKKEKGGIRFTGYGFGHGVGMSQLGAEMMGREGYSYMGILEHYYQNIRLATVRHSGKVEEVP